jgi:hypothetical protein
MKAAAKRVVQTLTVSDRVAIVPFSTSASLIAESVGTFYRATAENKEVLMKRIDALLADGETNVLAAFKKAFQAFEESKEAEKHVDCNSAILFLTDGEMTVPYSNERSEFEESVIDEISTQLELMRGQLDRPILLFTYSISETDNAHVFPRRLACAVDQGIWSKVVDDDEIPESLGSYSLLFTVGLSHNENFAAWVEPYAYVSGWTMGTTVSSPVYDREQDPPSFLGVAAIDFGIQSLDIALGVEAGSQETLDKLVIMSAAKCPLLEINECELEDFRRQGTAQDEALCLSANCTAKDFDEGLCYFEDDYPRDLWENVDYKGLSYEERVCCIVGETKPSSECPDNNGTPPQITEEISDGAAAGIFFGMLLLAAGIVGGACFLCFRRSRRVFAERNNRDGRTGGQIPLSSPPGSVAQMDIPMATVVPMAPPASSPSYNKQ